MREIAYVVRGFLTVRRDSLRVPLSGALTVHADPDSGLFSGDLALRRSTISRAVLGARLFSATIQIEADAPVVGRIDAEGRMFATVTVDAVLAAAQAARWALISGGGCRTATHAVVPLRSKPGFSLDSGGRLAGRYHRPPFTGCGWITPCVNLLVAGPGNAVVIDLIPRALQVRPSAALPGFATVLRFGGRPDPVKESADLGGQTGRPYPELGKGAGPDQPGVRQLPR